MKPGQKVSKKVTRVVNGFARHGWAIVKSFPGGYGTPDIRLFTKGMQVIELVHVQGTGQIITNKAVWR